MNPADVSNERCNRFDKPDYKRQIEMNQDKKQQNDENLFPVFRFDLDNRLIYANLPAMPLMKHWHCRINERVPGEVISRYPELFHASLSHRPSDVSVEMNNYTIRFSIVPFPEAKYIGMYAYCMELNENFVEKNVPEKVTVLQ